MRQLAEFCYGLDYDWTRLWLDCVCCGKGYLGAKDISFVKATLGLLS